MAVDADRVEDVTPVPSGFSAHLGFRYLPSDGDGVVVEVDPGAEHCNIGGRVHGGFLSALLDTTTGWAVHAGLPPGSLAPHVQLTVQYLRAAVPGQTLVCRGRAMTSGRRIAATEAEITQGGEVIARALATHSVLLAPEVGEKNEGANSGK